MKRLIVSFVFVMILSPVFAQEEGEDEKEEHKKGWKGSGNFALMFSQAAFNNDWQGGGTNNYAGDLSIDYELDYKKDLFTWDNNFIDEFGITKQNGDAFMRKTSDKLEIGSIAGYKLKEGSHWSYSFFFDFRTQFSKGYEYEDSQTRREITRFLSPGYLKFGPGILYKDGDLLRANFAPATSRFVFVDDVFTTIPGYEDGSYYGMDAGKTSRYEFGASLDVTSRLTVVENVELKQKLNLFTDYLDKPKNINLDYTLKLDMKINKYLSANFIFQAIYEGKAVSAFQVREGLGVGFSYNL